MPLSAMASAVRIPDALALVPSHDRRLRRASQPVGDVTAERRRLIERMFEAMAREHGVGLAAPQVGCLVRIIVVDVSPFQAGTRPLALVNPVVTARRGSAVAVEGCLSLPGIEAPVRRAREVRVAAVDAHGQPVTIDATGLLARVLQHEMDHLDGVLFIDRVGWTHRWRLRHALAALMTSTTTTVPTRVATTAL